MPESEFLIYDRRASARHVEFAKLFAMILLLACLAIFPFRLLLLPKIGAFIPVIDTMHLLFNGIIAAVLLSLASILRSKALIALGTGFFFAGLLAAAHALTYPDVFSRAGLLGANIDTATWLYLTWHMAVPAAIIVYALLKNALYWPHEPARNPIPAIFFCLSAAAATAAGIICLTTGEAPIVTSVLKFGPLQAYGLPYFTIFLILAGIALLWFRQRSLLNLALMLTLWALLMESVLILPGAGRFSTGWYAGRAMGLLSGLSVLLMLLIEISTLYGRMVLLLAAKKREWESRLMVVEAVGAFIAHELRQPLASMMLNAGVARRLAGRDNSRLSEVLDELVKDGSLVNDIVESTRAAVGRGTALKSPTNVNQLIRDTLRMVSHDLCSRRIEVELRLDDQLPPVAVNPLQMQQVLINLFLNAADAMSNVAGRPRVLSVQSGRGDVGDVIRVKDTGSGINPADREHVFDAFFTTKERGTGMGLAICRVVINAHGGTIQVSPNLPFGAVFEIVLPAEACARACGTPQSETVMLRPAMGN